MSSLKKQFEKFISAEALRLRYFSADEILVATGNHLNRIPPIELWANIIPTIEILDALRARLKYPIIIGSGFRTKAYNDKISGAKRSMHLLFNALDFHGTKGNPKSWAAGLEALNDSGFAVGGIGIYHRKNFVHVDSRTKLSSRRPARWTKN